MKSFMIATLLVIAACNMAFAGMDRTWFMHDDDINAMYGDAAETRGAAVQHRSLEIIRRRVANFDHDNPETAIPRLAESLRKLTQKNIYQIKERIEVYDLAQAKLLSTPGHARYFADEVERLIANPRYPNDDVRERNWYLRETLVHLPSPETIQVLGPYLNDHRFTLDPTKDNSGAHGPSYYLAASALRGIGLRESEEYIRTQGPTWHTQEDLEALRHWWELVKSGERTFSFKGQDVEYRFKPDGTWETIPITNPPDDGRDAPSTENPPEVSTASDDDIMPSEPEPPHVIWPWVAGGIALLMLSGALVYRMRR